MKTAAAATLAVLLVVAMNAFSIWFAGRYAADPTDPPVQRIERLLADLASLV
jgi:hypothetical protein